MWCVCDVYVYASCVWCTYLLHVVYMPVHVAI